MAKTKKQVLMKPPFLILVIAITTLVGCGEDIGRNNQRGSGGTIIPVNPEDAFITPSQMHRRSGTNVISSRDEIRNVTANTLPSGYRLVPSIVLDNEGVSGSNVQTRTSLGRPTVNCGIAANTTIGQRIADCQNLNQTKATWNSTSGIAGESSWRLVQKNNTQETWQDTRTGFLWSDIVATTNWCNAAGNSSSEDSSVNCQVIAQGSACVGKTLNDMNGVTWRLPTRNDYLQADLNGFRFVMKDVTVGFWTATISAQSSRNEAWVYVQSQGTLEKELLTENRQVRCVGAASL